MSIFKKLEIRETDVGRLLKDNKEKFEALFDLMYKSSSVRLLFLSNLDTIQRKEEPPKPTVAQIEGILMKEGVEESKAEKIAREIAEAIFVSISERRAVSIRCGNFGLIEPFDDRKIEPKSIPSLKHIYSSYFSNLVSVLKIIEDFGISITPDNLYDAYRDCQKAGVMTSIEKIFLCETCGLFGKEDAICSHEKIYLELFQLKSEILEAWRRGAILCGYLAYVLVQDGWEALTEIQVQGSNNVWHQVDVIAEKKDLALLCECKQIHPSNALSKDEIMKTLGVFEDLEKTIQEMFQKKTVTKIIVTTGVFDKEIQGIGARKDVLLIDKNSILMDPKTWRGKIWKIRG